MKQTFTSNASKSNFTLIYSETEFGFERNRSDELSKAIFLRALGK